MRLFCKRPQLLLNSPLCVLVVLRHSQIIVGGFNLTVAKPLRPRCPTGAARFSHGSESGIWLQLRFFTNKRIELRTVGVSTVFEERRGVLFQNLSPASHFAPIIDKLRRRVRGSAPDFGRAVMN